MSTLSNTAIVEQLAGSVRLVLPEAALLGTACVLFTLAPFRLSRLVHFAAALAGVALSTIVALSLQEPSVAAELRAFSSLDPAGVAVFFRWFAIVAAAVYILMGWSDTERDISAEYLACVLVVAAGVSMTARANDLITLFLSLEMISIPTYLLLYLPIQGSGSQGRDMPKGQESAMKYFLLSVLSAGVLLFGFSYLYGVAGSTNLEAIAKTIAAAGQTANVPLLAVVGIVFVIAGLGFRLAAVPFHFYAPDVYQGGPAGVVSQLAVLPKVAGFIALARVLGILSSAVEVPFDPSRTLVPLTLWVIAAVTMTYGNVLALLQDNLRRLFAYSGIAHTGYMLIGLLVACSATTPRTQSGIDAVLFYLVAYGLMTVGAFALLAHLSGSGSSSAETVDDLAGLGKSHPFAAAGLTIFLLSLIGLPLTAGFAGKFLLFFSAFEVPADSPMRNMYRGLALLAAVNAAVAGVYYLRAIGVMYLRSPMTPHESERRGWSPAAVVATLCAIATVGLGVYPQPLLDAARRAAPAPLLPTTPDTNNIKR